MNPIELLQQHCTFSNPYEVYVLFGISRKKYNDCTGGQEKLFREIIKHPDDIVKKYTRLKNSILAYRDEKNERRTFYMYVSVNPRDTRKAFLQLQREFVTINQELMNQVDVTNQLNSIDKRYMSCLMQPESRSGRGKFLIDIDYKDYRKDNIALCLATKTKILLLQETKNGFHILTEPFNREELSCNDYEIKTDSLLFVEWFDKQ